MLSGYLTSVSFKNGTNISLAQDSVLVVIGPNNSSKSATLSDIQALLTHDKPHTFALSDLSLQRTSMVDDFEESFSFTKIESGAYDFRTFQISAYNFNSWKGVQRNIGAAFVNLLVSNLSTRERLSDCDPPKSFNTKRPQYAEHPFQKMYLDDRLEADVSHIFTEAFKTDLIVHRAGSELIPLYVGVRPVVLKGEDRVSRTYLDRLERLAPLEKQGDGVRSFVSIVSRVLTEKRSIQLIDEPEAFLHPPQARLLASTIEQRSAHRQTLIATHSKEILQGLFASGSHRVSVVRLMKDTRFPDAKYLPNEDISKFWNDPILRFSNILDGLFHDGVVITEADADCRFYETLAVAVVERNILPDIHYTYSGGKDRVPVVVAALKAVGVPTASILDFDILNNELSLRKVIEAHGGAWIDAAGDWEIIREAVESKASFLSGDRFREEVGGQLKQIPAGSTVPKTVLSEIKRLSRKASPWDNVKLSGLAALPSGTPTVAAKRLDTYLRSIGIFVCPVGEMEGFCRTIGGHGPRWDEETLQRDILKDDELANARSFITGVVKYLFDGGVATLAVTAPSPPA